MSEDTEREARRKVGEVGAAAFSDATSAIIDTHSAVKTLAITVTLEAVAIAMFVIAPEKAAELFGDSGSGLSAYGWAVFFLNGFFIAFAVYRLIANNWPHRRAGTYIWLVSIVAGALNVAVLIAMV